jgi:RHS repeat-associated protein
MTDPTGTTTYAYDTAGRVASIVGFGTNVAYAYDPAGNRATMTAAGKVTTYGYDGAERLASVSRPDIGTFGFTYNPDGELSTITRPNGVTSTNSYDPAGRLNGLTYKNSGGTTIAAYAYGLDASGNRTSASTNGATDHYNIDPAGRLTGVSYADGTQVSFGYDAAGNRKSMTSGGSTTNYTYDAASQLTSAGSTTYSYDPAGNRTSAGSDSYAYDGFGNLASATAGATTIAYRTNGAGLRVSASNGSTTTTYAWDAAAALPALLSDGTNSYLSAGATLLAETAASASVYPLTDALGSVRGQTDATGAVTASASYGVYGDIRSTSGSVGSLGYTGALSDASGLVHLNARSMDPGTGTFTSRDPMTPGGPGVTGFNPYAYAGQNPVTYTDPSGRMAEYAMATGSSFPWKAAAVAAIQTAVVGLLVLSAILLGLEAGCVIRGGGCPIPLPAFPAIPMPAFPPLAIPHVGWPISFPWDMAKTIRDNWAQGMRGEFKIALALSRMAPFLFLRYHVYFWVPNLGARFLDICGYDNPVSAADDPQHPRFCAEVKTGNSEYTAKQQAKDAWISAHYGFPIWEWRLP